MNKYIFMLIFIALILTGCNKSSDISNEKNYSFAEWAEKNMKINSNDGIKKIFCPEINKNSIMSGSNNIFISENNIYKYDENQLFSNNKNCKLIGKDIDNKLIAVFQENAIAEDGTLYNDRWQKIDDKNYNGDFVEDTITGGYNFYFTKFNINKQLICTRDLLNSHEPLNLPKYDIITYTDDGLYAYYIETINSMNKKEYKYKINIDAIQDEKILKLYGTFLKTDRAFYMMYSEAINKEKCEKYVDIKCDYTYFLKKDEVLTKYYDDILNITNFYIITKEYELINIFDYIDLKTE